MSLLNTVGYIVVLYSSVCGAGAPWEKKEKNQRSVINNTSMHPKNS